MNIILKTVYTHLKAYPMINERGGTRQPNNNRQELALSIINNLDQIPWPLIEATALCVGKNQDYNSEVGRTSYFPFGAKSYAHMIHTKTQRLVNLVKSGKAPNNESLLDTLLDLINYASFMVEAIDSGEIK